MTNFIYNMQDELFDLNMILPVGKFSPIKKLVDHIEAQGKQLRELNAAIGKYEREKKELQNSNSYLVKKVDELNEGIRNSEDLTWKQKYDALLQSSEQAIGALQKKCQEYKNSESDAITSTIETLTKTNKELEEENKALKEVRRPWGDNAEIISAKTVRIKELEEKNKKLEHNYNELINQRNTLCYENKKLERANLDLGDTIGLYVEEFKKLKEDLEREKQVSKDLNVIINSKNKLLDEYMTKCDNLEHNYNEEVGMKEQFKRTCFKHERTIESQNSTIKYLKGQVSDYVRLNARLRGKLVSIGELVNKIDDIILSEE